VALPLLAAYVFDRFPAPPRKRLRAEWDGQLLRSYRPR
jgi:hypothetical protein